MAYEGTRVPAIPALDGISDTNTKRVLQAVKDTIEVREGVRTNADPLDQVVLFRHLNSSKSIAIDPYTLDISVPVQESQEGSTANAAAAGIVGMLSNEFVGLATDSAGTVLSFDTAGGLFMVFEGPEDKTGVGTSYAVNSTTSCTASINSSTGVYAVTAISADNASVTFSVNYAGAVIYKTMTLAKVRPGQEGDQGPQGEPGPTGSNGADATAYWMVSSASALAKSEAGAFTPSSVTFSAISKTGTGAPAAYAGRFKIYENGSGTPSYTSASNESSKAYTPSSSSVTSIKAELYLAGGTTTKIDEQSVVVVSDGASAAGPDMTIPLAITGLVATGAKMGVLVEWDTVTSTNHSHVEVWRATTDAIGSASMIGTSDGDMYGDYAGQTDATFFYWVRAISKAPVPGPYNAVGGTSATTGMIDSYDLISVDGAKIIDASILNAKIDSIDASKIKTGTLQASETIYVGTEIQIKGTGEIITQGAGTAGQEPYSRLWGGNLELWQYFSGTGYVKYNYLSRTENGVANNNSVVSIPGFWKSEPKIFVSPATLQTYHKDYPLQNQALVCQAASVEQYPAGSGKYRFTAIANLALASGSAAVSAGSNSGWLTAATTWSSGTYTTPENCSSITPVVNLSSMRLSSGSTVYANRKVSWRVRYTGDGSGGAWRVKTIGNTVSEVTDSYTFTFPSAGTYTFYIEFSAADDTGTFTASGILYDTSTASVTDTGVNQGGTGDGGSGYGSSIYHRKVLPAYTPDANWFIHSVNYTFQGRYSCNPGTIYFPDTTLSGSFTNATRTAIFSRSTYSTLACVMGGSGSYPVVFVISASAVINLRRPYGYTASGHNNFTLASYTYYLSTAQVLATGSLNWLAVGE